MWGLFLFVAGLIFAEPIARIFSDDPLVIAVTANYMKIVSLSYCFLGIMMICLSMMNGINKPMYAMLVTSTRMFVLYVPFAFLLSSLMGLNGIFWAAFGANILAGLTGLGFLWKKLKD